MKKLPYTPEDNAFVEKLRNVFNAFRTKGSYGVRHDPANTSIKTVVDIDSPTTLDAVQSWVHSINECQKANHLADRYLQAALLVCHIVKTKPIFFAFGGQPLKQVVDECAEYFERRFAEINEHFAFVVGLNLLGIEPDQIGEDTRKRIIEILYQSPLDPAHLALTFEMLYNSNEPYVQTESVLLRALAQLPSGHRHKSGPTP